MDVNPSRRTTFRKPTLILRLNTATPVVSETLIHSISHAVYDPDYTVSSASPTASLETVLRQVSPPSLAGSSDEARAVAGAASPESPSSAHHSAKCSVTLIRYLQSNADRRSPQTAHAEDAFCHPQDYRTDRALSAYLPISSSSRDTVQHPGHRDSRARALSPVQGSDGTADEMPSSKMGKASSDHVSETHVDTPKGPAKATSAESMRRKSVSSDKAEVQKPVAQPADQDAAASASGSSDKIKDAETDQPAIEAEAEAAPAEVDSTKDGVATPEQAKAAEVSDASGTAADQKADDTDTKSTAPSTKSKGSANPYGIFLGLFSKGNKSKAAVDSHEDQDVSQPEASKQKPAEPIETIEEESEPSQTRASPAASETDARKGTSAGEAKSAAQTDEPVAAEAQEGEDPPQDTSSATEANDERETSAVRDLANPDTSHESSKARSVASRQSAAESDTVPEVASTTEDSQSREQQPAVDDAALEATDDDAEGAESPVAQDMPAPVGLPGTSLDIVGGLTELASLVDNATDNAPLLGEHILPPPETRKSKLILRKARNLAMRHTLLKVLLGRQLAGPTKGALRTLARGEPVVYIGHSADDVMAAA
ncbi:MAG: hypothetical protein M1817_004965 [Caeruleum heppii]|nr:MAG: hypothetical protein M1817_004965 [Caeruleum heppii]